DVNDQRVHADPTDLVTAINNAAPGERSLDVPAGATGPRRIRGAMNGGDVLRFGGGSPSRLALHGDVDSFAEEMTIAIGTQTVRDAGGRLLSFGAGPNEGEVAIDVGPGLRAVRADSPDDRSTLSQETATDTPHVVLVALGRSPTATRLWVDGDRTQASPEVS